MAYSYDGIAWTGSDSFNTSYQDAFAFNTARANQITFDSNGDPTVTIHKPLTNVSTLEFALEYENQPAVSNVNVTIKVPVSGSGGGGGSIGDFVFDGSMIYIPSDSMNIKAPEGNINLEANENITIRANNSAIDLSADNVYGGIPIGGIILWSGKQSPAVPDGWSLCDGANNTPDLRGRFVVGFGNSEPFNAIDASGGEKEHTLTVDEMPSHGHSITDPGHEHIETASTATVHHIAQGSIYLTYGGTPLATANDTTASATTGITIDPSGGGQPHNNLPPYYVLAYIMRIR
jgi:microcystin-dependent protein